MPATKKTPTLGAEVNRLERWREKIRKLQAKLDDEKRRFEDDKLEVRRRMVEEGMDSIRGTRATASVGSREVARIEDYNRLANYVYRYKALDLLQNRVSITAVRERLKEGKKVPGVGIEHLPILNLRTRSN